MLFDELSELTGQRNAIDGRIVEIVAEVDRDELCGMTGARSVAALVAWKLGASSANAATIATVAHRLAQFPVCAAGMREGRLSLDQVGVIAGRAADGSDEHYAQLASVATVSQLRTAVKLEPRPEPEPGPCGPPSPRSPRPPTSSSPAIGSHFPRRGGDVRCGVGLPSVMRWSPSGNAITTHGDDAASDHRPPLPTNGDAFMSLVQAGWDAQAAARPAWAPHHGGGACRCRKAHRSSCIWVRCSPMPTAAT